MRQFKRDLLEEHREPETLGAVTPDALAEGRELRCEEERGSLLRRINLRAEDLAAESKSAPVKGALAAALKQRPRSRTTGWASA